jgi:hypothetical protein
MTEQQAERFWGKVDKRGPDECWNWLGCVERNNKNHPGYGRVGFKGNQFVATHVALTLDGRPRPGKLLALHSCNNPRCVNPAHLRWGSHYDNTLDAVANGTKPIALTQDQAEAIRNDERPQCQIAAEYGCSQVTVSMIKRGVIHKQREPAL